MSRRGGFGAWVFGAIAGIFTARGLLRGLQLAVTEGYFAGKVVLITGASRGIGRALAHAFAAEGAHLVLASRNAEDLQRVAEECALIRPGVPVEIVPTDVTDEGQLRALTRAALDRFHCIDVLVNNAGIMQGGAVYEIGPVSLRQQIEVNLLSAMHLTQLVLPHMLTRQSGHVVFMSSASGRHGAPYYAAYSTSKHGLRGFGDALRREMLGTGVRVHTIFPGWVDTALTDRIQRVLRQMGFPLISPEQVAQKTLRAIRLGEPETHIGLYEAFGGWWSTNFPGLTDIYWRVIPPRTYAEDANHQRTE